MGDTDIGGKKKKKSAFTVIADGSDCGSKDSACCSGICGLGNICIPAGDGGGKDTGAGDGGTGGGDPTCVLGAADATCSSDSECCSGFCNLKTNKCLDDSINTVCAVAHATAAAAEDVQTTKKKKSKKSGKGKVTFTFGGAKVSLDSGKCDPKKGKMCCSGTCIKKKCVGNGVGDSPEGIALLEKAKSSNAGFFIPWEENGSGSGSGFGSGYADFAEGQHNTADSLFESENDGENSSGGGDSETMGAGVLAVIFLIIVLVIVLVAVGVILAKKRRERARNAVIKLPTTRKDSFVEIPEMLATSAARNSITSNPPRLSWDTTTLPPKAITPLKVEGELADTYAAGAAPVFEDNSFALDRNGTTLRLHSVRRTNPAFLGMIFEDTETDGVQPPGVPSN